MKFTKRILPLFLALLLLAGNAFGVGGYKFTAVSGGGAGAMDAQDGAALADGDIAIVTASGTLTVFQLDADSGAVENGTTIISPDTNAGTKRWLKQSVSVSFEMPVGSIIPYFSGYFGTSANGSYTDALGDSDAEISAIINPLGWYLCNGAALNLPGSPIFDGAGRYLPNLNNNRFPMGGATMGATGGSATHSHSTGDHALTIPEMPAHDHDIDIASGETVTLSVKGSSGTKTATDTTSVNSTGGGEAHNHGTTSGVSTLPTYLAVKYIMRAI